MDVPLERCSKSQLGDLSVGSEVPFGISKEHTQESYKRARIWVTAKTEFDK